MSTGRAAVLFYTTCCMFALTSAFTRTTMMPKNRKSFTIRELRIILRRWFNFERSKSITAEKIGLKFPCAHKDDVEVSIAKTVSDWTYPRISNHSMFRTIHNDLESDISGVGIRAGVGVTHKSLSGINKHYYAVACLHHKSE